MNKRSLKAVFTSTAAAFVFVIAGVSAQADDATVVAKIGGVDVTEADVKLASEGLDGQFAKLPEEQRRLAALAALLDIKAVAMKAKEAKVDEAADFKARVAFLTRAHAARRLFPQPGSRQGHRCGCQGPL